MQQLAVHATNATRVSCSDRAAEHIRDRGGSIFVWASHHRCCGGLLTLLDASTTRPAGRNFIEIAAGDVAVFLDSSLREMPDELHLDLGGLRCNRVRAFWNGCAFVL